MKFNRLNGAIAGGILSICTLMNVSYAGIITVEDANSNVLNCIPFTCAGAFGPYMTNVYKDLILFNLSVGDTIAFDLSGVNNVDMIFDIYLASTTSNGSVTADLNGFTKIVSNGNGGKGTVTQGDYELLYTIDNAWSFSGGGLMIAFNPKGVTAWDFSGGLGFFGNNNASGTHVAQYYSGASVGTGNLRRSVIPNFQITTQSVPEPSTLAIFTLAIMFLASRRFKKQA